MAARQSAGTCISFSATAPATQTAAGYAALTWTVNADVINYGDIGGSYNVVENTPICSGVKEKQLGSFDPGTLDITASYDPSNAAHTILKAAFAGKTKVSVKIVYATADIEYFQAFVTAMPKTVGGADDILQIKTSLLLTTTIVPSP
ncbi:MAG: hypothetical protein ACKO0Z_08355 [Betaproteobacteria bacterium]